MSGWIKTVPHSGVSAESRSTTAESIMRRFTVITLVASIFGAWHGSASALSMKECSTKYEAAKAAGSLSGMKWNDFRKAQCGAEATPAATAGPASTTASQPAPAKPTGSKAATSASVARSASPVFPSAISPKYAKESEGKGRMHTCLDQYNANKAANANGGLNWIAKGGGYYSECNKHLKS